MRNVIAILVLSFSCGMFAQKTDSIKFAFNNYNYEQVILLSEPAGRELPIAIMRAQSLKALNRTREAINELQHVLSIDSTDIGSIVNLAECFRQSGDMIRTAEYYGKAFRLQPGNTYFQSQYFNSLINLEEYDDAINLCHEVLSRDSTAFAYRLLGQAYQQKNDLTSAFFAYNIAYRKDSLDYVTVSNIAAIFNDNRQYDDAIEITEKYRLSDSTNIAVNRQTAKAYCMKFDYKTAIERYESLKSSGDRSFTTFYYLGISYYGDQWFYGAYDNLKLALQKAPNDLNILYYLGLSAVRTSWKDEGVGYLQKAIELAMPDDSLMIKLYKGLADCYSYVNKHDKYVDAMLTVYKYTPNDHAILFKIADYFDKTLKNQKQAIYYYEKYMKVLPEKSQSAYYESAHKRVAKLKEELFFKGEGSE